MAENSPVRSIFEDVTKQPNELWLRSGKAPKSASKLDSWPAGEVVSFVDDDGQNSDAVVDMEKDVDHAAIVAGVCAAPLAGGDPCKSFDQCCCEDSSCLERLLERPVASGGKVDRMLSEWLLTKEGGPGMRLKEEKMEEEAGEEEEEEEGKERSADSVVSVSVVKKIVVEQGLANYCPWKVIV